MSAAYKIEELIAEWAFYEHLEPRPWWFDSVLVLPS